MTRDTKQAEFLAQVLRGRPARWDSGAFAEISGDQGHEAAVEAIAYHGVALLLLEKRDAIADWPNPVLQGLRQEALGRAMWEMREKLALIALLERLAEARVQAVLLKGAALAYDLYANPADRPRGDCDVLIHPSDVDRTRQVLRDMKYVPANGTAATMDDLQEEWSVCDEDGYHHPVDLHWAVFDAPALTGVLKVEEVFATMANLPALGDKAWRPSYPQMLFHACLHRSKHLVSQYYVEGRSYVGGDRLIWYRDMQLLSRRLDAAGWENFLGLVSRSGTGAVCLDAFAAMTRFWGETLPAEVLARLSGTGQATPTARFMLRSRGFGRAWSNLLAVEGAAAKLRYLRTRLVPSRAFLLGKYPGSENVPTSRLVVRRWKDFILTAATQGRR